MMVVMVMMVSAVTWLTTKVNGELCFLDRRLTFRNRRLGNDSGRRRIRDFK